MAFALCEKTVDIKKLYFTLMQLVQDDKVKHMLKCYHGIPDNISASESSIDYCNYLISPMKTATTYNNNIFPKVDWIDNAYNYAKDNRLDSIVERSISKLYCFIDNISHINIEEWIDPEGFEETELAVHIYVNGDYEKALDDISMFDKEVGNDLTCESNYKVSFIVWPE